MKTTLSGSLPTLQEPILGKSFWLHLKSLRTVVVTWMPIASLLTQSIEFCGVWCWGCPEKSVADLPAWCCPCGVAGKQYGMFGTGFSCVGITIHVLCPFPYSK